MRKLLLHVKHPLVTLLFWGLVLRILLLFFAYSWDVNSHITWGKEAIERGLSGFYDRPTIDHFSGLYPNYPPLSIYLFMISYQLYRAVAFVLWSLNVTFAVFPSAIVSWFETREVIAGFLKLPPVLADIGVGVLLYKMILKYKRDHLAAWYAVIFYLFNPVFWYTSALWGQIESIGIFFILWSFYLLLYSNNRFIPLLVFTFAVLTKQTTVIFVPIIVIAYLKKYSFNDLLKGGILSLGVFWIFFIPFYQQGNVLLYPFNTYLTRILTASGLPFVSNHAFNFWAIVTGWQDIADTEPFVALSYRVWGYVISIIIGIFLYWRYIGRSLSSKSIYFMALIYGLTIYMFFTRIHERHIQQAFVFLIPFAVFDRRLKWVYVLISIVHFMNLYHNWSIPRIEWLMPVVLSLVTVNISILLLLSTYIYILYLFMRRAGWMQSDNKV